LLDRTDSVELKKFNELVARSFDATFPENLKKAILPEKEFDAKVAKFDAIAKNFKKPSNIQNYKKKEK
jgi:DNA mismatch repair ATPase MutS